MDILGNVCISVRGNFFVTERNPSLSSEARGRFIVHMPFNIFGVPHEKGVECCAIQHLLLAEAGHDFITGQKLAFEVDVMDIILFQRDEISMGISLYTLFSRSEEEAFLHFRDAGHMLSYFG